MNAFSNIFFIEPLIYHKILTAQTGHALHALKTALYELRPAPPPAAPSAASAAAAAAAAGGAAS